MTRVSLLITGRRSWPVRQYLRLMVVMGMSMILVITAVSLIALRAEDADVTFLNEDIGPAYYTNAGILQTMTVAETGLRGYLIDHNLAVLQPYTGGEQQVRTAQNQLRALLASPAISASDQQSYAQLQTIQDAAIASWWRYANGAVASEAYGQTAGLIVSQDIFGAVQAANAELQSKLSAQLASLQARSQRRLAESALVLLAVMLFAVLAGFVVAGRISRGVTAPIMRLREVALRHREGDTVVRADAGRGPSEVRDLASAFNVLAAHHAELTAMQAQALQLDKVVFDVGRAIRVTTTTQEALDVACTELGSALQVRRVAVTLFDERGMRYTGAQWHAPGLDNLPTVTDQLQLHMSRISQELWSSGGRLVIADLLAEDLQRQVWPLQLHRECGGTTAFILMPIGLGERAIGNLYVMDDTGPREWTDAEVATAQQVGTFLARAIIAAEDEARRSEHISRLESLDRQKTDFLATVSHELRTPLTSIQGYLELLLEGDAGPLGSDQQRMLGVIERNAARLRGLIEDILVLNRIESDGLVPNNDDVSVRELVADTVEELRPLADKSAVRLCTEMDDDAATVTGDRMQLQRALVNVLSNAIKFTPGGGTVRLSCRVDPAADEVVVVCQDTGIGIPQADLEHLFTRFFRASNAARKAIPGTGLGLAIVEAIVEAHHGRLALDSVEGEGTTVTLRLPWARTTARTAN